MKETLKRYGVAFAILAFVIFLMLLGTLGVTKFEKSMFQDMNVTIKPVGERLN